jgi:hypothetical protein
LVIIEPSFSMATILGVPPLIYIKWLQGGTLLLVEHQR